ncbi:MAG: 4Fe-4S binding protein [Caldilinea sp.]|nr:4Fe-4S binding protein [Caldilineaceae bacterium]MCO5214026.1 4Fe-4S binding protein [Caldilinea sp.]
MSTATLRPRRHRPRSRTQVVRRLVQTAFLGFIIFAALRHSLFEETTTAASIDALCPFGGVESLWRMISTGEYVPKTHPSNLVLMTGLLLATVAAGAAFCGWICPFGTLQDFLTWLRERVRLPAIHVPDGIDRWLRYGRYVMLALVLYMTVSTVKLWFADYDPYRTIFGLGWIFEFNAAEHWPAYTVALSILGASFFIPRFWCKYACPLGGALSLVSYVSFLRIRRTEATCKSCALCSRPCPMGIAVEKADPLVSTNCIGCLECVDVCPRHGALEVAFMPSIWWKNLRGVFGHPAPAPVSQGESQ